MNNNLVFDDLRVSKTYDIATRSGIGKRESQQDAGYLAANDNAVFAVLCDGMGGIAGGEMASKTAVEAFTELYQFYMESNTSGDGWMRQAAETTDDIVFSLTDSDGYRLGAGTTLVSITISCGLLRWISIGDSRIYLVRGEEIVRITNDHNYFLQLDQYKSEGLITADEYKQEAECGDALLSYIGMGGLLLIDINEFPFELQSGDSVLLCTDGLYRAVSEDEMLHIMRQDSASEIAQNFEQIIAERSFPNQDNYTYIIIKKV